MKTQQREKWGIRQSLRRGTRLAFVALVAWVCGTHAAQAEAYTLVVLDPLAKELACACVKGYGQRDYRKLASHLEADLKERVEIEFSDDLADTVSILGTDRPYIVVGERSVAAHGAQKAGLNARVLCDLTGQDGETALNALFVVRAKDPARELKDINGRKIIVGLPESDDKHAAAMQAMKSVGVEPSTTERRLPYTDAALDVLDSEESPLPVAIVPGYGPRLLEGCGSITPGDLRVIARTESVPFISVLLTQKVNAEQEKRILESLLAIKDNPKLLREMESKHGFKPAAPDHKASKNETLPTPEASNAQSSIPRVDWPDWRGAKRDGKVPRLPEKLPSKPKIVWKKATMMGGLAGLSVRNGRLLVAERDFADEQDVYRCIDSETGELLWRISFPAPGSLDYGQFPRATPVQTESTAYLLGAFGELRCVRITDGKVLWKRNLPEEFGAELPTWGMCSTPLIADDRLIVNPGATNASLAALDLNSGETRWTVPGKPAAYSSFILGTFGNRKQIIGYDENSLGGWDVKTGQRLWELIPPMKGDFNVPTPIVVENGIVLATENNGTRLHRFDKEGCIIPQPEAHFADLFPDTATPVVAAGRLFGAHLGLHCLELNNKLKPVWHSEDRTIGDYASLIADEERVLIMTLGGELVLLDGKASAYSPVSRVRIFPDDVEIYSHPAMVGSRLFVRGGSSLLCVDLEKEEI